MFVQHHESIWEAMIVAQRKNAFSDGWILANAGGTYKRRPQFSPGAIHSISSTNTMSFIHSTVHSSFGLIVVALLALAFGLYLEIYHLRPHIKRVDCVSVNYRFTRKCNKTCKFCFHTE
jgi:hypothetical protein